MRVWVKLAPSGGVELFLDFDGLLNKLMDSEKHKIAGFQRYMIGNDAGKFIEFHKVACDPIREDADWLVEVGTLQETERNVR